MAHPASPSPPDDGALDGTAAAGRLSDVFAFDVTVARTVCATCHDSHAVAELRAYLQAPGVVLRCTSCGAVQLRHVRSSGTAWIDLRGIDVLEVPVV